MIAKFERKLLFLFFLTVNLIGFSSFIQAAPQTQQLYQRLRVQLTSGAHCEVVMKDYLARMVLGLLPEGQTDKSAALEDNYVASEPDSGSPCQVLVKQLVGLSPSDRMTLARAMANDADGLVSSLGANLLFTRGQEDEAARAFAKAIASGQRQRMYFAPSTKTDQSLWGRIMVKTSRYLLANFDTYQGAERSHVQEFLSMWSSTIPFSREEAERRIAELERKVKK